MVGVSRSWRRRARLAGGDDYDASNDIEGAGPAYFGFVRDQRGSPVSDAAGDPAAENGASR